MVRPIAYLAVALFAGAPLRASELDADFGAATPAAPAATLKAISPAAAATAPLPALIRDDRTDVGKESELDAESPAQSCFFFRRGLGWGGYGLGWGGGYGLGWGGGYGLGWGGGYGLGWGGGYGLGWGGGYGPGWGGGYGLGWGGWGGGYGPWLACSSPSFGFGYSPGGYW